MRKSLLTVVLLVAVAVTGCRSSRPVTVGGGAPTASRWHSLVGQRLLLRGLGETAQVTIKAGKIPRGTCDVAVEVVSADPAEGGVRLALRSLGRVRIGEAPTVGPCKALAPRITLTLTGGEEGHVDSWLQTPEAYLAGHGKPLEARETVPEPKVAADVRPAAPEEAHHLARRVTVWPKPLLSIEPALSSNGKVHHEGEIELDVVVGADGRLFNPRLLTPQDENKERDIESVLTLWRFEPAREGKTAVPAHYSGRTVLRIY
jgi:hypothetical protein